MKKEDYFKQLSDLVFEMEEDNIIPLVEDYLSEGYDAMEAIDHGLIPGMDRVGVAFDEEEYFVTDLLFAADTMYMALDILKPCLSHGDEKPKLGKIVIGDIQGDTHDIGKNLVKMMLETAGFEMIDLGKDVLIELFVETAIEEKAQMICMSSLMSTTMENMRKVIEMLKEKGVRDQFKVMIGGGPVTEKYAQEIGADAYAANATEAVIVAKKVLEIA